MQRSELAIFAGLPLILSAIADVTGGLTTDLVARRFGRRAGRCGVGAAGYVCAGLAMLAGTLANDARLAASLIAVGGAASMFTLGSAWATAIELGGRNAAVLGAVMNTAGQVGGILSPIALAYIVDRFDNWNMPLHVSSVLYFIAAFSWIAIKPEQARDTSMLNHKQ